MAAAFAVASGNFAGNPEVLVQVMDVAMVGFIILLIIAGELGRRSSKGAGKSVGTAT